MKISIIIPTYNPGNYIKECLQSINAQNLPKEDFEVIIVLNGEINGQKTYLQELLKNFDFEFQLLTTYEKGVSKARNIGLEHAKGYYICFIDDDDMISHSYLKNLLTLASPNKIVASNVKTFMHDLSEQRDDYITRAFEKYTSKSKVLNLWKGRTFMSSSCCKIISKDAISNIKFNETLSVGEDSVFMTKISKNIKEITLASSDTIYYRRLRVGSASRTKRSFRTRVNIVIHLWIEYAKLLKPKYNFAFVMSRIAATGKKLFTLK